jgi:hypothetical protein
VAIVEKAVAVGLVPAVYTISSDEKVCTIWYNRSQPIWYHLLPECALPSTTYAQRCTTSPVAQ